jgi:hypothetical protein
MEGGNRIAMLANADHLLILPFRWLWYHRPDNASGYAMYSSRSHDAVIRVYDATGNMIETLEHAGDFKEW